MSDLIRTHQVEKELGCSRSMVLKLIDLGELRAFKVGSEWRVYKHSVQDYIEKSDNSHTVHTADMTG